MTKKPKGKFVRESALENKEYSVCRHQLNRSGAMHGGELVKLIDEVAAIVAWRHSGKVCVTASLDSMHFVSPIFLNEIIVMFAACNRVWTTSMEIGVKAYVKGNGGGTRHVASAYLTFVALDENRKPTAVPVITPETSDEKQRYRAANKRRRIRLKSRPSKP